MSKASRSALQKRGSSILSYLLLAAGGMIFGLNAHSQPSGNPPAFDSVKASQSGGSVDSAGRSVLQDTVHSTPVDSIFSRHVPESRLRAWRADRDFAYANDSTLWLHRYEKPTEGMLQKFLKWIGPRNLWRILVALMAGLVLYAVYRIVKQQKSFAFQWNRSSRPSDPAIEVSGQGEAPLDEQIREAIGRGDWRLAVRYMYWKALQTAASRNWIQLKDQATPRDYCQQMAGNPMQEPFRQLTKGYEYVWYGEWALPQREFENLQDQFQKFYQAAHR